MSFLQILTRTFNGRPTMLDRNIDSLQRQTDQDFIQTFLVDAEARGIDWSHENMAAYAPRLTGDYIWILDDDDLCICDTLVEELKAIALNHDPDLIFLKMDHGGGRILPDNWKETPILGRIGVSAFVVRKEIWQANAGAFIPGEYSSDYTFIARIYSTQPKTYWHDRVASKIQVVSYGAAEQGVIVKDKQIETVTKDVEVVDEPIKETSKTLEGLVDIYEYASSLDRGFGFDNSVAGYKIIGVNSVALGGGILMQARRTLARGGVLVLDEDANRAYGKDLTVNLGKGIVNDDGYTVYTKV